MPNKLYKILGTIVVLFIFATMITFTFGFLLIGAAALGLYGLYRYFFFKQKLAQKNRRFGTMRSKSRGYSTGEIVDMPLPDTDQTESDRFHSRH